MISAAARWTGLKYPVFPALNSSQISWDQAEPPGVSRPRAGSRMRLIWEFDVDTPGS
jgi:hypothetical protein